MTSVGRVRGPLTFRVLRPEEYQAWDDLAARRLGTLAQLTWWVAPLQPYGVELDVVGCWRGDALVGGALIRTLKVPGIPWALADCFTGPLLDDLGDATVDGFLQVVRQVARRRRAVQVSFRSNPDVVLYQALMSGLRREQARVAFSPEPAQAVVAVEGRSAPDVAAGFRRDARASLRKGQAAGTEVRKTSGDEELRGAYGAFASSAERKGFDDLRPWEALGPAMAECLDRDLGAVYVTVSDETVVAAIFVSFVGSEAEYLHGGFHVEHADLYPNHVLHVAALSEALDRGLTAYNMGQLGFGEHSESVNEFKRSLRAEPRSVQPTLHWQIRPGLAFVLRQARSKPWARALRTRVRALIVKRSQG